MEKAKEITPAEEIMVTTEEIVTEAKDEVKEAPSRMRKKTAPIDSRMEGCQRAVERLRIGCYGL